MVLPKPLQEELNAFHANICGALADTKRIAILYELAEGPKSVGKLVATPSSTIGHGD